MAEASVVQLAPDLSDREVSEFQPLTDALVGYLGILGKDISVDELIVGMPVTAASFNLEDAQRAIRRIGFISRRIRAKSLDKATLPVCAEMQDGSFLVILKRTSTGFTVAHPEVPGALHDMSRDDLQAVFAGQYLTAGASVGALEQKHVGDQKRGHWFWRHILAQRWVTIEIVMATLVANVLAVAVSLFALQVYDRVIPNSSIQTLWVLAAGAIVAIVFEVTLKICRGRLVDDMGRQADIKLSAELVSKLHGMRMSDRAMGPAALGSMMREFSAIREFFTATAVGSLADIPFVAIFLGLIYVIAGPVVWIVGAALVAIILLSLFTRRTLSRVSEEMQGANAAQSKLLNEMTYGAEAIKLHRAENRFQAAWEELSQLISSKTQAQRATSAQLTFLSQGIQQFAYISAVVVGVFMVFAGEFSVGAIIAVSILTTRTIAPVTQLSGAIARWQQVRVSMEGLSMIAQATQERDHTRHYARRENLRGEIEIRDLHFRYAEDQDEALAVEDLRIAAGETVAILGRNGSGKSTLLKILSGLYDFERGEVRFDGLEIRQLDPVDLRRNMGVLSQDVTLFSGTLRDNLNLGPHPATDAELEEALQFSGLWSMVQRHPMGLDMVVSDGGVGLSVGQRQSLGLARIYLSDPQIVLLDEPTAAMDQSLEAEVIGRLRKWLQGKTCLLTTHRTEIISLCDRIGLIHDGRLALTGPRDEVLAKLRAKPAT